MKKLLLLPLFFLGFSALATDYYIAANGNDANNGTSQSSPWKSINKLNAYFSNLKAGDKVLFRRGDTFYGSIAVNKSGNAGNPITIGAYGSGEKPEITGFTNVTSWNNLGGNIWESSGAVSNLPYTNMVVINGVNTAMGRWPNTGSISIDSYSGNSITSSALAGTNWDGAELSLYRTTYSIGRSKILNHNGNTLNYEISVHDHEMQYAPGWFMPNFIIQNDARTLDVPNEWYFSPSNKKLRIFSFSKPNDVKISTIDTLLDVGGGNWQGANYIVIENLYFTGSNKSTILVRGSKNVTIQNSNFNYAGINTIYGPWAGNSANLKIENCSIDNSNNCGIYLEGDFTNPIIKSNTVSNTGMIPFMIANGGGSGIAINTTGVGTKIELNTISNASYNGINFFGSNSEVIKNYIRNFCVYQTDGGGIYTGNSWNFKINSGMKIFNNILIDGPHSNGIYLDDKSNGIEVAGNTVYNCRYGLFLHDNWDLKVYNNTTYNNGLDNNDGAGMLIDDYEAGIVMSNIDIKENIFFAKTTKQNTGYFALKGGIPSSVTLDNNYYVKPIDNTKSIFTNFNKNYSYKSLAEWKQMSSKDQNSNLGPKTISDLNELRFEYNATTSNKTINLDANYIDAKGINYNGSIILQPFSSAVLIRSGAVTNQSPTANAGPDKVITLPISEVTLQGSGSDNDGTIVSYNWSQISGPTTANITGANLADPKVSLLTQGEYQFKLVVTDNQGGTAEASVKIQVNSTQTFIPIAYAGADQIITLPTNTTSLTGVGWIEKGSIVSYLWSKITGPNGGDILNKNMAATDVINLSMGIYEYELIVTDDKGMTARSKIKLTVNSYEELLPAVNPGSIINGLDYNYYEGIYNTVSNFGSATVVKSGVTTNFTTSVSSKGEAFALNFTGYINVPSDGYYTFYTNSDDGSKLWIDGVEVVNNDGLHGSVEKSGQIGLKAGLHAINVKYFNQWGDRVLTVSYSGNGIAKQVIPASTLYRVSESDLLPAVNPGNTVNGLDYNYYEGIYNTVPNFGSATAVKSGVTTNFTTSVSSKGEAFALNFTGYINVPSDGYYTFYTNSDDGSKLWIDGVEVVNNDGLHSSVEKSGQIGLKAGLHAINVKYFNQWGDRVLTVSYSGNGIAKQVIPASTLYRVSESDLLPAVNPGNTVNGLDYNYYEGIYNTVPNFGSTTVVKSGVTTNFITSVSSKNEAFALNFTGYINVPTDGYYTFYTNSDDGSKLFIDGVLVVNNDGLHGALEKSGQIGLKAGLHAINVGYFNQWGDKVLTVSYSGNGIAKQVIPASNLYRVNVSSLVGSGNWNSANMQTLQNRLSGAQAQLGLKVYPNPFVNYVTVNITGEAGEYKLQLIDALGRILVSKTGKKAVGSYQATLNTSSIPKGFYILKLLQNGKSTVFKLEKF